MNSFTLTAIGNLTRNPELSVEGDITFSRFCLVGHDPPLPQPGGGKPEDDTDRDDAVALWFFAYGEIATAIARTSRKGDQLILQAFVVADSWLEKGERQYGHTFIVTGFRLGAKGGGSGPAASSRWTLPPGKPQQGGAADAEPPPNSQEVEAVAATR